MPWRARFVLGLVLLCAAGIASGCGDEATAADGPVTLHMTNGKDPTGVWKKVLAECSQRSNGRYTIEEYIMPPTVDGQREQMIRRLAGKDPSLDILGLDVIWTAEFSDAGWIYDMTEKVAPIRDQFMPASLATAEYKDKVWAIPRETNVALLYYRTDIVDTPPKTWEEMVEIAKAGMAKNPGLAGYVWQGNQYEGMTVDALEILHAQGAKILDDTGKVSLLNEGDAALKAFQFMQRLYTEGITPRAVTTYQEEESRQMFQAGKAIFLRNWPYVYPLANEEGSAVKGKFDAVPLPKFKDAGQAAVIGGQNLAISKFSRYPDEAFEAIDCITSVPYQLEFLLKKGNLPSRRAPYSDPEVRKTLPFIDDVEKSLTFAHSRPTTPYYNDLTVALARNSHKVVAGQMAPEQAVAETHASIQKAVVGEGEI